MESNHHGPPVCKLSIMAPANKPHENGKKLNKFKLESQGPANKQVLNLIFNLKLVLLRVLVEREINEVKWNVPYQVHNVVRAKAKGCGHDNLECLWGKRDREREGAMGQVHWF